MFTQCVENPPQIDETGSVHLQGFHSGPPCRGGANDDRIVGTPPEMFLPSLLSGMIERRYCLLDGVKGFALGVLVAVAALTSQRQILQGICPSVTDGNDMLYGKGVGGKIHLTKTILTTSVGTFDHLASLLSTDTLSRHTLAV